MPGNVVLLTKIRTPVPRREEIRRERLLSTLALVPERRLTLISAPPGYGKTTLVSQWAESASLRVAWYSLDETDNDLMKFWRYLIASVSRIVSGELDKRMAPLLGGYPSTTIETIVDVLLAELEPLEGDSIAIVLDDYHSIADPSIHASIDYLIERMPGHVRLIVASRHELPLSAAKWRVRRQLLDIRPDQLLFTEDEIRRFCDQSAAIPLTEERLGLLCKWTEGWAASLQLIALTLKEHDDPDRFFRQYAGTDRSHVQYLLNEVFGRLPSKLREFLLRTSVLSRFDAAAAEALAPEHNGREMLERLLRLNLFLVPLDDAGGWHRYHHLFAKFLREQLEQEDAALIPELHRLAARHLAERRLPEEALEHSLEAGDAALSVPLLGGQIASVLERGEWSTLLRWMRRIPQDALPFELSLLCAFTLIVTGEFADAAEELRRLERLTEAMEPGDALQESRSGLFFAKINLAFSTGDYEQWYAYADRIPDMLPESPWLYRFNYNTNEPFVRRTAFGLRGMQNAETDAIALRIVGILEEHGWGDSLFTQYILQSLAEGYCEWNRLADCSRLLRRVEPIARRSRTGGLFVPNRLTRVRLLAAEGRFKDARSELDQAIELVREELEETVWLGSMLAFKACLDLKEGNVFRAEKALASLKLSAYDSPSLLRYSEYIAYARLLGMKRKEKEALGLLGKLGRLSHRENCISGIVEVAILQALLNAQRGFRGQAFERLREALEYGADNGYIRSFLDEGEAMLSLLSQFKEALERGEIDCEGAKRAPGPYVAALLELFPRKAQRQRPDELPELLSPKETAVLLEAARGAVNREIAERLHLTEGTVKVYLSRIYGKLGVATRVQALRKAEELRLFESL
ncbi:LuxR C-terminal-related transcriptional regulator [Cohnella fermenti]|uniref:Transcriptional regulator n=1 Tax=Cohnella fermenti TaxID=2565925 RepID=A0A4V3WDT6_9BACL|nr:LuxR C-terminal-related transcriptional regulator [Cohnella fermenti]THF73447.1 transcriptional regulator [Cohnella fermenti]